MEAEEETRVMPHGKYSISMADFIKMEEGPQAKECRRPLESKKSQETGAPLEPPERNTDLLIP